VLLLQNFIDILVANLRSKIAILAQIRNFLYTFAKKIFNNFNMNNRPKEKLIEVRKLKGFTQKDIADRLNMEVSGYCKMENGQRKITIKEWGILQKILDEPLEKIYEEDDKQSLNFKDNATTTGTYFANSISITVPEALLETQQKYIKKLEAEIAEFKLLFKKK
jgi:transcriptional regulator with XRE-family HTH domain